MHEWVNERISSWKYTWAMNLAEKNKNEQNLKQINPCEFLEQNYNHQPQNAYPAEPGSIPVSRV